MKSTGTVIRVSKQGKIRIPPHILNKISFDYKQNKIEFIIQGNYLILQKKDYRCFVTGKSSNELTELLPDILVSREGMEILLHQLKERRN